jgi:hypothetical protein
MKSKYIYLPNFYFNPINNQWVIYSFSKILDCTPKTKKEIEVMEE